MGTAQPAENSETQTSDSKGSDVQRRPEVRALLRPLVRLLIDMAHAMLPQRRPTLTILSNRLDIVRPHFVIGGAKQTD